MAGVRLCLRDTWIQNPNLWQDFLHLIPSLKFLGTARGAWVDQSVKGWLLIPTSVVLSGSWDPAGVGLC